MSSSLLPASVFLSVVRWSSSIVFFLLFGCGPRVILDFTGVPFTAHETEVNKFELPRREICPFFMVQSKIFFFFLKKKRARKKCA